MSNVTHFAYDCCKVNDHILHIVQLPQVVRYVIPVTGRKKAAETFLPAAPSAIPVKAMLWSKRAHASLTRGSQCETSGIMLVKVRKREECWSRYPRLPVSEAGEQLGDDGAPRLGRRVAQPRAEKRVERAPVLDQQPQEAERRDHLYGNAYYS